MAFTASTAWAGTETYTFYNNSDVFPHACLTVEETSSLSTASGTALYQATYAACANRFAFAQLGTSKGMQVRYKGTRSFGLFSFGQENTFAITNLVDGDKITVTAGGNSNGDDYSVSVISSNTTTEDGTAVNEGTEYNEDFTLVVSTTEATTHVDFTISNTSWIKEITIVSSAETVTDPKIEVTGVNGTARTVTITPGASNDEANTATTYYTTNGDEPSATSTEYTEPFSVSSSCTVKAITISSSGKTSQIVEQAVEAGTEVSLAQVTSAMSDIAGDGTFNVTYALACDNSDIIGAPEATYSYVFTPEGGSAQDAVTIDGNKLEATECGTYVVTAAAEGYTSTTVTIENKQAWTLKATYDVTTIGDSDLGTWSKQKRGGSWGGSSSVDRYLNGTSATLENFNINTSGSYLYFVGVGIAGNSGTPSFEVQNQAEGDAVIYYIHGNNSLSDDSNVGGIVTSDATVTATLATDRSNLLYQVKEFEPATMSVTIGTIGYCTFSANKAFSVPANVIAYTAAEPANGEVALTAIEGDIIPANTGVVLGGTAGTYTLTATTKETTVSNNNLQPSDTSLSGDGSTIYVLGENDGKAVFGPLAKGTAMKANKAYFKYTASSSAKLAVVIKGDATGINEVGTAVKSGKAYNLQGIEVSDNFKGLYIKNGKKVIK